MNQKNGVRWNARKAFLDPVKARPNLRIVSHTEVIGLTSEGSRITGVTFLRRGKLFQVAGERCPVAASQEIIDSFGGSTALRLPVERLFRIADRHLHRP